MADNSKYLLPERILIFLTKLSLSLMVAIITYQVISRYLLNFTPRWSEEVSQLLMVWYGLLGASLAVRDDSHIGVRVFVNKLNPAWQKRLYHLKQLLIFGVGIYMVCYGWELTKFTVNQTLAATKWPASVVYAALPVSGLVITIYAIRNLFRPPGSARRMTNG